MTRPEFISEIKKENVEYVPEDIFEDEREDTKSATPGYTLRRRLGEVVLITAEAGAVPESAEIIRGPIGRGVRLGEQCRIESALFGFVDIGDGVIIGSHGRIGTPLGSPKKTVKGKPREKAGIVRGEKFVPQISIGERTRIGEVVCITPFKKATIQIGAHVHIGDKVHIGAEKNEKPTPQKQADISIGAHTTIADGTTIRYGSVIGQNVHIEGGYILIDINIPDNLRIKAHGLKKRVVITGDWLERNPHLVYPPIPVKKPEVS